MIMVNSAIKVHTFTNNPANITNTKISAVNALVLNVCLLIAKLIVYRFCKRVSARFRQQQIFLDVDFQPVFLRILIAAPESKDQYADGNYSKPPFNFRINFTNVDLLI